MYIGMKNIIKIGTVLSVLLFVFAVGCYVFMRLDVAKNNRDADMFSLVPSGSIGVLESDNVNAFFNEYPDLNYNRELDGFHFPGLFEFLINGLSEYTSKSAHELGNRMSRLVVSFHHPGTSRDQVVYFQMGMADEQMLSDMLQNYAHGNFLPKEDTYRGKKIWIYPLSDDEFLAAYVENGCMALSYQKRLIEEVIDAQLDETSLSDDVVFSEIQRKKKSHDFLTLYGRSASLPFLDLGMECWSEYNFHLNSDVVYLTGDTYIPEGNTYMEGVLGHLEEVPVINEQGVMISAQKDSTAIYMNQAYEADDMGNRTLFNECVANLSNEVAFSLVADMEKVQENPNRFQAYLPPFVLENVSLLRSFILSVQLSINGKRPSHIWVFTYKN